MEEKKLNIPWWILIIIAILLMFVFVWQLNNLEMFFKHYPNAINGSISIFTLFTTIISIIVAYKSYKTTLKQRDREEKKQSELVKRLLNHKTQHLRTRINTVNIEYITQSEEEDYDLLYITMEEKDTRKDITEFIKIVEQIHDDKLNHLTLEDQKLVNDRILMLNSLLTFVNLYIDIKSNKVITNKQLKKFDIKTNIQERIDKVTQAFT